MLRGEERIILSQRRIFHLFAFLTFFGLMCIGTTLGFVRRRTAMANVGSLNAVRILKGEAEEEKAETARLSSFVGAIAIGDLMKSTLGPKGMVSVGGQCIVLAC